MGTGIRHRCARTPSSLTVISHRIAVIEAALLASLMTCLARPRRVASTARPAVHLLVVGALAEVEDLPAPTAPKLDQNQDDIHSRLDGRIRRTCPARPPSGTFARSASTRDTKAWGSTPGPSFFRGPLERLRDLPKLRHFSANRPTITFLRI
jgi:hypothetical protein